jgi:phage host-nuclease inhibitor protein Gam
MAKRKVSSLASWTDVDSRLNRLCVIDTDRRTAEVQMNAEISAVKLRFQDALNDQAKEDAELRGEIEQFAREHPEAFSPSKTIARLHGVLSFRTTPPSVVPLSRQWTAERVLEAIHMANLADQIVRVPPEEIDKPAILAKVAGGELSDVQLRDVGLRISQREVFGLDLKYEGAPKAQG